MTSGVLGRQARAISDKYESLLEGFEEHRDQILEVQRICHEDILQELADQLDLSPSGLSRARAFIDDPVTIFRFLRRTRFHTTNTISLLQATLHWRLESGLDTLSASSIEPQYIDAPVFYFHPDLLDRSGRPCGILNLQHVSRPPDGSLDSLKEFIAFGWEIARRWLADLSRISLASSTEDEADGRPIIQLVVIVDLAGAGMSNLEVELLPYFIDLLKKHFPGMVSAIFVVNYGWMYSGMWQVAKRVLPQPALDRILFPSSDELADFFEPDHLLTQHGGTVRYDYDAANPILVKYGKPAYSSATTSPHASPHSSRPPSRSTSYESIYEVFYSAPGTPWASRPTTPTSSALPLPSADGHRGLTSRPSWLSMTSLATSPGVNPVTPGSGTVSPEETRGRRLITIKEGRSGSRNSSTDSQSSDHKTPIRRVGSLRDFRLHLPERSHPGDESATSDEYDSDTAAEQEYARRSVRHHTLPMTRTESTVSSVPSSHPPSIAVSRTQSRDVSPSRSTQGHLSVPMSAEPSLSPTNSTFTRSAGRHRPPPSPYSAANPYYGYSYHHARSGDGRPHESRRRKRDLVRTLSYLLAMRFLRLHREIQWRIELLVRLLTQSVTRLRITSHIVLSPVQRTKTLPSTSKRAKQKVSWAKEESRFVPSVLHTNRRIRPRRTDDLFIDPRWIYYLLIFVLLRAPYFTRLSEAVFVGLPKRTLRASGLLSKEALSAQSQDTLIGSRRIRRTVSRIQASLSL
ncbi:uncharacterized protein L969DRAFT_47773 [Mixia osmundae IAM 14324]|uniref:CRAL-TRIO domain-containing protein n=1 Tax=Mixia osmundae (strain CBS 9802 / IAM 14324 / JCM 22182 / KY 12970) TaxID=764103 RepID=G7DVE8_MIXOS|nr:uncharacterized protein L969DRAFT_47773 [Mixia osmundae IAM 14324]KEI40336.1 hypothetical protein L969DRAFT_47773 [Mixia osmundae IAM 14324]GAA94558.1 hypothetical protein E5Q_01210 [Mixia osmundae IAM 14324]